jgi:Na+/proline symporter/nitrogen-specific signal transduction histidine kinase
MAVTCLYMASLLVVARWTDRRADRNESPTANALVYALAPAVYCTAWTYYGSVGAAANSGLLFLTIYLGPTLAITLWWTVLRKLVRIKSVHRITSVADLISARYDHSQAAAALAALVAFVGVTPYVALQFRAIESTFAMIVAPSPQPAEWIDHTRGGVFAVLLVVFTIVLGARRLDPTERHPGMMMALAVECLVKLFGFLAVGIFVTYFMFDGFADILNQIASVFPERGPAWKFPYDVSPIKWMSYLVLSMSAIMFLPRQFHVQVVENLDERHIKTAMWSFPLYLFLINIFTFPVAMGGLLSGLPAHEADTFVLGLPMREGRRLLSLLVFIGGFSAAAGMIMVCSIAMSTMITNHLVMPIVDRAQWLAFLRRHLLACRWVAVAVFVGMGYWCQRLVGHAYMLVNMGIISFAAALQFAPPVLCGLFWRRGNKLGALLGLAAGSLIWFYTMLLPAMIKSDWLSAALLDEGPWGIGFLRPEGLFGVTGLDPVSHTVFWSMFFNLGLYVVGSLSVKKTEQERARAEEFVGILDPIPARRIVGRRDARIELKKKRRSMIFLLVHYFDRARAASITDQCIAAAGLSGRTSISIVELAELRSQVEKYLAGSIGAAQAHRAMKEWVVFTPSEAKELSLCYAEILADLAVPPEELQRRVDYFQERETLLTNYANELEEKVGERTRELEAANRELKDFAYVVSHDLKAPLRAISQLGEWISQDYATAFDDEGKEQMRLLLGRADRMHHLIEGILDYSRIGRVREKEQPIDLNDLVRDVIEPLGQDNHMRITVENRLPVISCERTRLQQVFENLVDNAIKFMDKPEGDIRINCVDEGTRWRFCVADNGPGIDRRYHEKIFQIFQTLAPRDQKESTGIGLTLVKKIIDLNGGQVWVESEEGSGSRFFFTLAKNGGTR